MKKKYVPTFQGESAVEAIGKNLKIARLRRNESETLASQRLGISRTTYQRIEAGDPSVASGILLDALLQYGFDTQVFAVGSPDHDDVGKRLERLRLPKRGRTHD